MRDSHSDEGPGHFFLPLSSKGLSRMGFESKTNPRSKKLLASQVDNSSLENCVTDSPSGGKYDELQLPNVIEDLESLNDFDQVNGFLLSTGSKCAANATQMLFYDIEESQGQVFSPPLLMESSLLADSYEDLLGMLLHVQILNFFLILTCMEYSMTISFYLWGCSDFAQQISICHSVTPSGWPGTVQVAPKSILF